MLGEIDAPVLLSGKAGVERLLPGWVFNAATGAAAPVVALLRAQTRVAERPHP